MHHCFGFIFPIRLSKSCENLREAAGSLLGSRMVGAHGFEPWTSSLSEMRSNQLSYAPFLLSRVFVPPLWGQNSAMRPCSGLTPVPLLEDRVYSL